MLNVVSSCKYMVFQQCFLHKYKTRQCIHCIFGKLTGEITGKLKILLNSNLLVFKNKDVSGLRGTLTHSFSVLHDRPHACEPLVPSRGRTYSTHKYWMTNVTVPPPSAPADTPITFFACFFLFLPHFSLGSYTIFNNWSTHPRSRQQPLTAAVWSHSVISTVSQVLFPKSHFSVSPQQTEELTNACACDKVSSCEGMWALWLTVQRAFQRVKLQHKAIRDRRSQIQHPQTTQGYLLSKCKCFPDFSDRSFFGSVNLILSKRRQM